MLYYYIMVDPDKPNRCKVGITKDIVGRLRSYRTASPNCVFAKVYNIPAKYHEKRILDLLKDITTVHNEYVHSNVEVVSRVVEGYFRDQNII